VLPAVRIRSCIFCLTLLFACAPCAGLAQAAPGAAPGPAVQTAAPATPAADLSQKNVLVLHALESNVPVFELTDHGIRAALDSGGVGIRNQFFEYLDLVRNPSPEHRKLLMELMRQRYSQRKIDLIITQYPEALIFALDEGRTIFPEAPIIALYLPLGSEPPDTGRHIIRQFLFPDLTGTLEIALNLAPGAKRVYVVSGVRPVDRSIEDRARQDFKKWEGRLEFRYLSDLPLEEILAAVSSAPPDTIVFFAIMAADVTGRSFTSREVGKRLGEVSSVPVFGLFDSVLGYGIAGGSLISFENVGTRASELALDILRGTQNPENIPAVLEVPYLAMFDWRQLRHWNLNEDALPKRAIVVNRESTFRDFKYYIIGALAFIVAESILIVTLLAQKRRRRSAEESLRQKNEELDNFFSMSLDLLCIASTDGYFLRLNPAWEKTLGFNLAELMSKRYLEFVHPDDVAATLGVMKALDTQSQVVDFTNRYRGKGGSYRLMMWSAAAVGNLIYAAARDITERLQAAETLREREMELQSLTDRLILGQEEERRRLARELHDDLSQRLAVLAIQAGKTESAVKDGHDPILKPLRDLRDQTIQIAADVHDISRRLHPSILDDLGLSKAVEAECTRFSTREGIEVAFSAQDIKGRPPQDISLSLYRIVQEGLNNIAKHACAHRVAVSLNESEEGLHLSVKDDGIGFDAAEVRKKPGLGLSSIRERVRLVQGRHRITSEPEKGTTIEVTVPLKKAPNASAALSEKLS
jgi:PAS domain S-box-containing protein